MTDIYTEAINSIQKINQRIASPSGGTIQAPLLAEYPAHLETLVLPIALTQIGPNSLIPLNCSGLPATLNMAVTIYVQAWNQDIFPNTMAQCYQVAASWYDIFRDGSSYLYGDAENKTLLEADDIQLFINPTGAEAFSGYTIVPYPTATENRYHSVVMGLSVRARDGDC